MSSVENPIKVAAILSAVSAAPSTNPADERHSSFTVAGQTILELQIDALVKAGVSSFFFEVDSVGENLLEVADRYRSKDIAIEFVRSVEELQALLTANSRLLIQAENHFFSDAIVQQFIGRTNPFIATLDSRVENGSFERIDLNTRWAGFAALASQDIIAMAPVPDDWSIGSSLLRHAIQIGTHFQPIPQGELQSFGVLMIDSQSDASALGNYLMNNRMDYVRGGFERYVFGPVAKALAPQAWTYKRWMTLIGFSGLSIALLSAAIAIFSDQITAALLITLLSLFLHLFQGLAITQFNSEKMQSWRETIFWAVISVTGLALAANKNGYFSDDTIFMTIIISLSLLARKIDVSGRVQLVLHSPAFVVIGLIISNMVASFGIGLRVIVITQIALLLAGRNLRK